MMPHQREAVAHINDLKDGEMKQVSVNGIDILLSRVNGNYYAIQGHCSHYGAPLAKGALCGTQVTCPWHHACFDVTTGKHLNPPGMDGLPAYEVLIKGDQVFVHVLEDTKQTERPVLGRQQTENDHTVIVGGGTAGAYAAQTLREAGYTGKITVITAEDELPYDRTKCSKKFLQDEAPVEQMPLRERNFYELHDINVLNNRKVIQLDAERKSITFEEGEILTYNKALLCTGGKPQQLEVPGVNFSNVHLLRSMKDSQFIKDMAKGAEHVAIVGASFIGMECASSLQKLGCVITVISPDTYPFASKWGERIGKMIRKMHEEAGIQFLGGRKLERIEGDTKARQVVLDNGDRLAADLVVVGIGVKPATDYVQGLAKAEDGGIEVDQYLYAGKDVYAAGDIARFDYQGSPVRIEHWRVACQQGKTAGLNLAGKEEIFDQVPFFWTAQQGKNIRYVGFVKDYDDVIYQGEVEAQEFMAFYIKGGAVKAVLGMNRDTQLAVIEVLMREHRMPDPAAIKNNEVDWLEVLKKC